MALLSGTNDVIVRQPSCGYGSCSFGSGATAQLRGTTSAAPGLPRARREPVGAGRRPEAASAGAEPAGRRPGRRTRRAPSTAAPRRRISATARPSAAESGTAHQPPWPNIPSRPPGCPAANTPRAPPGRVDREQPGRGREPETGEGTPGAGLLDLPACSPRKPDEVGAERERDEHRNPGRERVEVAVSLRGERRRPASRRRARSAAGARQTQQPAGA